MSGVLIPFLMPVYPGAFPTFTAHRLARSASSYTRQHRHAYAAGFQRGLLTVCSNRLRSWPAFWNRVTYCIPAHIRQIGAGGTVTGLQPLIHSRYAFW